MPTKLIFQVSMMLVLPLILLILLCLTQVLIRSRIFKKKKDDIDQPMNTKEPLHVPNRPITRFKTKVLKEALNGLILQVLTLAELGDPLEHQEKALVHLIHVQEGPNPPLCGL